ncbi:bacitracin ABC transporter permease [Salipaludibacillus neizhouensis]|uniref:Bacitracin ABC transporter permease n=1 Tax=Salipaludibacillus neizhouensis TaxID=885475 RepID=A0A3A9K005_9BACI|nr:FtsX-like permease family protein [Salipaludibacillus neizhouensis]RKL66057.1 bacitracin ABC transporter permease [Salipaludibacillus neizhouensis]
MTINQLIYRNLKKNIKNYYLYVFALIFSVALYFAFVTLQYDPSMDATKGSIKGGAAVKAASVLLIGIVNIFLLYANNIFIKRRSKELALFQLIGMTKGKIFQILSFENFILYFSSLIIGTFLGFSISKITTMILFKVTGIDAIATLQFSVQALIQTLVVFGLIYLFIMLMNYIFIKRASILSLFNVRSTSEIKIRKTSMFEIILGVAGIVLIASGYFLSSMLFDDKFMGMNHLFLMMIIILASVITGTYFFYKGSVNFIFHLIRKRKDGYLTITETLSLSSIMFRMKSNALLLTIITTVSALAIGLLSLSYISYYSAEKTAEDAVAADFTMTSSEDSDQFKQALATNGISFNERVIDVIQVSVNIEALLEAEIDGLNFDPNMMIVPVVSDLEVDGISLSPETTLFTGYNDIMQSFMPLKDTGEVEFHGVNNVTPQEFLGLKKAPIISAYFTNGGLPTAIVDESTYERLSNDLDPEIQKDSSIYIGISVVDNAHIKDANAIFNEMTFSHVDGLSHTSQYDISKRQKINMGLIMFIVGFLGLAFLNTSGCILYFKQMGESEDEKSNYTILRKLGFTQSDLLKGIQVKQLFNFGIPLVIGLLHSFFAVQSGWFFFGTEIWTPMIIVMSIYTILYSIFGILSVLYYKKVVKESLT